MERQLSVTPAKKVVVELSTLCSSLREGGCNPIPHTRSKHAAPVFPGNAGTWGFRSLQARGRLWVPGLARGRRIVCPLVGSRQLVEQPLRFFQVGGVEALGEP